MKLKIDNFRRIKHLDLQTEHPVVLLIGDNRQGKTSIMGALQVALTGSNSEWLSRQGESLSGLIHAGEKSAEITLQGAKWLRPDDEDLFGDAAGDLLINRKITASKHDVEFYNGSIHVTGVKNVMADLSMYLGCKPDQISVALNASELLRMDAKNQTDFMAAFSGADYDYKTMLTYVLSSAANAEKFVNDASYKDLTGTTLLDAVLTDATKKRPTLKKNRDTIEARITSLRNSIVTPDGQKPEGIITSADLQKQRDNIIRRETEIKNAEVAYTDAQNLMTAAASRLADVVAERSAYPQDSDVTIKDAMEKAAEQRDLYDARIEELSATYNATKASLLLTFEARDAVQTLIDDNCLECPTCHAELSGDGLQALYDSMNNTAMELQKTLDEQTEQISIMRKTRDDFKDKYRTHEDDLNAYIAINNDHEKAKAKHNEFQELVKKIRKKLVDLNAAGNTDSLSSIDEQIKILQAWDEVERLETEIDKSTKELEEATMDVSCIEWVCEQFGSGPNSIRATFNAGAIEKHINKILEPLLGQTIIMPDGTNPLRVADRGISYPATSQYMSGSERLRLQIALQYALCRMINLPILAIDCDVAVDPKVKAQVLSLCHTIVAEWPELTVLMSFAPVIPDWYKTQEFGALAGWGEVWRVDNGTASLVDRPVAVDVVKDDHQTTLPE